jgi:hypothetical protein
MSAIDIINPPYSPSNDYKLETNVTLYVKVSNAWL